MDLATERNGEWLVLTPPVQRLDRGVANAFRQAFVSAVRGRTGPIALNLVAVTYMDSAGLGSIIAAYRAAPSPSRLYLTGVCREIEDLIRLTRLDAVLPILPAVPRPGEDPARACGLTGPHRRWDNQPA